MRDREKTKDKLINELVGLRQRVGELEFLTTERKQAEDALRESERRFRDVTENTLEWVWEVDAIGKYTYASPVCKKILGYKPEELLEKHFYDLFVPEEQEQLKKTAFETFANKQPFREFINQNIHKSGRLVWMSTSGAPILDEKGNLLGYRGTDMDITKRKQAEEKEKEYHKNIELLSETAMQFVEFPTDKNIYNFIGEQLRELIGKDSYIVINTIDKEKSILTTRAVLGIGKFTDKIAKLLRRHLVGMTFDAKDAELVPLFDGKLHLNEEGLYGILLKVVPKAVCNSIEKLINIKKIYGIGFTKDNELFGTIVMFLKEGACELKKKQLIETFIKQASIAIQKRQAEEELKKKEAHLQTLVNTIPDLVWMKDPNGVYLSCNSRVEKLYGASASEIIGKTDYDFVNKELGDFFRKNDKIAIAAGKPSMNEEELQFANDGHKELVETIITPIFDTEGNLYGILGIARDITERKIAEEEILKLNQDLEQKVEQRTAELKDSEEKNRLLLESTSEGIFGTDNKGKIIFVNPAVEKILGFSAEELLGSNAHTLFHHHHANGEEYPQIECPMDLAFSEGKTSRIDNEVLWKKDGTAIPAEYSATPMKKDNELIGSVITFSDITERKQAEQVLSEANNIINRSSAVAFLWKNEAGWPVEFASENVEKLTGYSSEEFVEGRISYVEIIHSDDLERVAEEVVTHSKKEGLQRFSHQPYRIFTKNGAIKWIDDMTYIRRDSRGIITHYEGIVNDITERKKGEDEIKKLNTAIEQSPVSVVITDIEGMIQYVNPFFTKITGYSYEEAIGQNPRVLKSGKHDDEFYKNMWDTLTAGKTWEGEIVNKKKNGELYWESALISPVLNENGEITSFIGVKSDITEKKKAVEDLAKAKEVAESATKAKGNFLANMSHEIRTPMNAIIGFSEILADKTFGELNNKQSKYINNVLISGRHLLQLINDILDLSKIEAGKMELETSKININSLLENSMIMIKEKAMKHGVKPNLNINQEILGLNILADERKFKQIIFNLLSNAVKFTPDGGSITTSAYHEGKDLFISVSDTGIGIKPEDQERIFGKFEQVDSSYARQQRGTGLGLALTSQLVKLHGGRIWVESEGEGKGSTFTFVIPIKTEEQKIEVQTEPEKLLTSQPKVDDSHSLILVVEDDRQASELISHYLSEAGYAVANAFDGAQAIEMARKLKPCAITLDIILPKKNGWDVLTELKSLPETVDIPVVIVSVVESRLFGLNLGAIEYFIKPLNKDKLIEVMQNVTNKTGKETKDITVLIIDDEPKTMDLLTDMLQLQGFDVLQAYGGQEGIDLAIKKHPDVIILDLMMPDVSGFDVAQQLRANFEAMEIPILVYTAKDLTEEDRQKLEGNVQAIALKSGSGKEALLKELKKLIKIKSGK